MLGHPNSINSTVHWAILDLHFLQFCYYFSSAWIFSDSIFFLMDMASLCFYVLWDSCIWFLPVPGILCCHTSLGTLFSARSQLRYYYIDMPSFTSIIPTFHTNTYPHISTHVHVCLCYLYCFFIFCSFPLSQTEHEFYEISNFDLFPVHAGHPTILSNTNQTPNKYTVNAVMN